MPAEEETDSRDPYHHPWSGVVAKTPRWAVPARLLLRVGSLQHGAVGCCVISRLWQGC